MNGHRVTVRSKSWFTAMMIGVAVGAMVSSIVVVAVALTVSAG